MRHRKKGRRLGRSSSHRRAMLRNLASSLFLTERDAEFDENPPKVKGRVVTTVQKAKEVRGLVEKCVTIARRSLKHQREAEALEPASERGSGDWKTWRESDQWREWNQAIAPVVAARRRCVQLLGDKEAVQILFDEIAPRFEDRDGGYTRVLRLAGVRLGDAGTRAILEFVGENDRISSKSQRPAFSDDAVDDEEEEELSSSADDDAEMSDEAPEAASAEEEAVDDESGDENKA